MRVPDFWPDYDVIAQRPQLTAPERISVKTRTFAKSGNFIGYAEKALFDWLAIIADAAKSNAVLEIASGEEVEKAVDQTLSMPESIFATRSRELQPLKVASAAD